ncbi:carbohydrate ABC transporter permease [Brachybacterium sp. UMB0905]|uniref:carbohydrate ABC transporter permease n=1 Tax=Brachybacterium sp. UMB0905 TaxID=2069310 RepID=UPI000C80391F|nr:sugar ABC transporter permease [Brachybacterium sp. UMB0905]PMC74807.1 sugar ABC transporter permease [Brachybacterium sp. UMB0905]
MTTADTAAHTAATSGPGPQRKPHTLGSRMRQALKGDKSLAYALVIPAFLLVGFFAVYPFVIAVWNSLSYVDLYTGERTFVGLQNFKDTITDPFVLAATWRSVIWTASNMVLQVLIGVIVAMLLNAPLRGRRVARALVLVPYMVPAIVAALIFQYMFNDVTGVVNYVMQTVGVIDEPLGWLSNPDLIMITIVLVNVWKYSPFFTIIVLARLQSIPHDLYEAVSIDGGSWWHRFTTVTLPSIIPVVLAGSLFRTIWTAYDFDIPFLLSGGGGPSGSAITMPLAIRSLAFEQLQYGQASALAIYASLLLAVIAAYYLWQMRKSRQKMG